MESGVEDGAIFWRMDFEDGDFYGFEAEGAESGAELTGLMCGAGY